MFRRVVPFFVAAMLLSLVLVACGDEAAPVPSLTGSTSITVPETVKTQFASTVKGLKNPTFEAYKNSGNVATVKTNFTDNFSKNGWEDKAKSYLSDSDAKTIEQVGMFVLGYQKGNKGAVIMGFPGGPVAEALGFKDISSTESGYIVISGNQ